MMKIGDKMKKRKVKKGPKIILILLIVFLAIGGLIINQKNQ